MTTAPSPLPQLISQEPASDATVASDVAMAEAEAAATAVEHPAAPDSTREGLVELAARAAALREQLAIQAQPAEPVQQLLPLSELQPQLQQQNQDATAAEVAPAAQEAAQQQQAQEVAAAQPSHVTDPRAVMVAFDERMLLHRSSLPPCPER